MLNPDYKDILSVFVEEKVEFLLVGAYAMAVYGLPRTTGDIDLWIRNSEENAEKVIKGLIAFGTPMYGVSATDFTTPDLVFQIGVVPWRIDILSSIDGVKFEEAWHERRQVEIEGIRISVISRRHLIQNKRSVGRLKDESDADWLEQSEG